MTYEIEIIDNHIIFKENNLRLLLDTGSPISISNHSKISVFGKTINPHRKIMGNITIDNINCSIKNAKLDALIGGDILNKVNLYISISNKLIKLNPVIKHEEYDFFAISKILSIPTNEVKTKDREIKMFIDTGAKNSYLNPKYIQLKNEIRIDEDFYPGFGEFKTNIYQHEIQIFNTCKKLLGDCLLKTNTYVISKASLGVISKVG